MRTPVRETDEKKVKVKRVHGTKPLLFWDTKNMLTLAVAEFLVIRGIQTKPRK